MLDHHAQLVAQGAKRRKRVKPGGEASDIWGAFSAIGAAMAAGANEAAAQVYGAQTS